LEVEVGTLTSEFRLHTSKLTLYRLPPRTNRELEVFRQLIARSHDGEPPAEHAGRNIVPRRVAAEEQIAVPQGIAPLREHSVAAARWTERRQTRQEPSADSFRFVPAMFRAWIGQQLTGPFRLGVAGVHAEPDDEHARVGFRMLRQEIVLRPPGASHARRSRGRQEQDQPRLPFARVEPGLELVDASQMPQPRGR
jgi:hypothetical protein